MTGEALTVVVVQYRKKRLNHRILFGTPVREYRLGWRRSLASFLPGQVFGYERWRANRYGTQAWSIAVGRACAPSGVTFVEGIHPGLDLWLHAIGKTRVKRVFDALSAFRDVGIKPSELPERRWRALNLANEQGQALTSIVGRWTC
ncbi:DUF2840 domain-containing protein [uncultured Algimonas sp.]|uniref:DUF2840 domain-containing protein n=1 Tax=uncultured Algimonas sp. TaxID=1547920 RepID=UPI00344F2D4F